MKLRRTVVCAVGALAGIALTGAAGAASLSGALEARYSHYEDNALYVDQANALSQFSLAAEVTYQHELSRDAEFTTVLYAKQAAHAEKEHRADIRELSATLYQGPQEYSIGVLMEKWGVLEAHNPIDSFNPKDILEDYQGSVKLGVPGLKYTSLFNQGRLDLWLLPYSREAKLPQGKERFRVAPLPYSDAVFDGGKNRLGFATRYSHMFNNSEAALSFTKSHARSPYFSPLFDGNGALVALQPHYTRVEQLAGELLHINGQNLLKIESLYQRNEFDNFFGMGIGVEHELPSIHKSKSALTLYGEYYYDDRNINVNVPITAFQNDLFLGARFALNDLNSTEFQARYTYDLDSHSTNWSLLAEQRIGQSWFIDATLNYLSNVGSDTALKAFANDSNITINLTYGF